MWPKQWRLPSYFLDGYGVAAIAKRLSALQRSRWRYPQRVQIPCLGQLLLGVDLTGIAVPVARVAGIALIGLAVACWPGPPLVGMLTYSALVALYLAYLGSQSA